MKPAPFVYHRPDTVDEALEMLADIGPDGKVLAGGQSLVPLMSMRLATPAHLIDINRIGELGAITVGHDGVTVGAAVRHASLEHDDAAFESQPLLREAIGYVAHPTIRNRGTTVGSLVHADPAGELTGVLALLGGTVRLRSTTGERVVPADQFFVGALESAVQPTEMATDAFFPALPPRSGIAWHERSRRNGDYAICGAGALVTLDEELNIAAARLALISVASTPVAIDLTDRLRGRPYDFGPQTRIADYVASVIDPEGDIHASADYRRHLAGILAVEAFGDALDRALEGTQ
jgi:carbon-monoxide dehydrogenase medium subunit